MSSTIAMSLVLEPPKKRARHQFDDSSSDEFDFGSLDCVNGRYYVGNDIFYFVYPLQFEVLVDGYVRILFGCYLNYLCKDVVMIISTYYYQLCDHMVYYQDWRPGSVAHRYRSTQTFKRLALYFTTPLYQSISSELMGIFSFEYDRYYRDFMFTNIYND